MARGQTVDQGPENVKVDGKQGPKNAMYMTKNSDNESLIAFPPIGDVSRYSLGKLRHS